MGSVRRALSVEVPFSSYVFSDLKRKNVTELHDVVKEYSHLKDRIRIATGDANDIVQQFCRELGTRDRALIFLDPFGNQVRWETLEVIAKTRKVDLWYLFPAWLGVARQIKSNGIVLKDAEASIDQMLGSSDWRKEAVSSATSAQQDMFATESSESQKIATGDGITRYMIKCMETIFGGGVSQKWLPLGRGGRHYYSLLFACANPGDRAKSLAQKVARDIMTRK